MQPAEQAHQDRTATAIVAERDLAFSIDRGQRKVGSGITGAKGAERHDETLLVFESIQERQHHERVGLEPGPLTDGLGLLHELFRPALVAQVQVHGGEAIITGKQQLRLVGLLGSVGIPRPFGGPTTSSPVPPCRGTTIAPGEVNFDGGRGMTV